MGDVWISRDPLGHIQATGYDKAGRKQYVYHASWEEVRDEVKFERLGRFGQRLPALRRSVNSDLRSQGLAPRKVIALAVAVSDRTLVRVGNPEYAVGNESYGLTTLTCEHVEVDGKHVHLEFEAKGGAECQLAFEDRRIADLVAQCQELDGQTLFSYETPQGESASVSSSDVNKYLTEALNGRFTAKDFRTWGASSLVVGELARSPVDDPVVKIREAIEVAATQLGNSWDVCRDAYVHLAWSRQDPMERSARCGPEPVPASGSIETSLPCGSCWRAADPSLYAIWAPKNALDDRRRHSRIQLEG